MVLGTEWLADLGEIKANFKEFTLKINQGGRRIVIKGDTMLYKSAASLQTLIKVLREDGDGCLVNCQVIA